MLAKIRLLSIKSTALEFNVDLRGSIMKIVGEKLERWALEQKAVDEKDLFGRSAFNRYYYAVFLLTREMLGKEQCTRAYQSC